MIDIESAVFSKMADVFDTKYPDGVRYSEPVISPAKFPCLTVIEEDNYTYDGSLDADHKEHHAWVMFSVNVYSNLIAGGKQECFEILNLVDSEFMKLGFMRLSFSQTKNQDTRIYRMTARYRAVVSEDYRIYRR